MNEMLKMFVYGNMIKDDICIPYIFMKLIFTVIFPPLGVWIEQHQKGYPNINKIGINLVLTAMFFFPGLMHALHNVTFN